MSPVFLDLPRLVARTFPTEEEAQAYFALKGNKVSCSDMDTAGL